MRKSLLLFSMSALALFLLCGAASVYPDTIASASFTTSAELVGSIAAGETFVLPSWTVVGGAGALAGLASQDLGDLIFDIHSPTSITFGSPEFGSYMSTSISKFQVSGLIWHIVSDGTWMAGTVAQGNGVTKTFPAQFTIVLTQIDPDSFSASGTFTAVIPEPPSIVLLLTGLISGVVLYGFRLSRLRRSQPQHAEAH